MDNRLVFKFKTIMGNPIEYINYSKEEGVERGEVENKNESKGF